MQLEVQNSPLPLKKTKTIVARRLTSPLRTTAKEAHERRSHSNFSPNLNKSNSAENSEKLLEGFLFALNSVKVSSYELFEIVNLQLTVIHFSVIRKTTVWQRFRRML